MNCFVAIIVNCIKYTNDPTITEIRQKCRGSELQIAANEVCSWSAVNHLGINTEETKEIFLVCMAHPLEVALLVSESLSESVNH